jgi:hypothetical protein
MPTIRPNDNLNKGGPSFSSRNVKRLNFTVDASLLRELGERLVGRPHIALAELIKNAYDADARHVKVIVEDDRLIVEDDGHGMSLKEFRDFWMRIGTPHKQAEGFSRSLRRPLTGSKGVGRLAVQFLARRLTLSTTAKRPATELTAAVDWNEAVTAGDLTSATASYSVVERSGKYTDSSKHGTRIELTDLNDEWTPAVLTELAQELWTLQPPFGAQDKNDPRSFSIDLESPNPDIQKAFQGRIRSNLELWTARVRGRLLPREENDPAGTRRYSCGLQFRNSRAEKFQFTLENCVLDQVEYDIRIFSLHGRQRFGINVDDARDYLRQFGAIICGSLAVSIFMTLAFTYHIMGPRLIGSKQRLIIHID